MTTRNLFGLGIVLLALAVLVATSVAYSPVAVARDGGDRAGGTAAAVAEDGGAGGETYTVSSGGIDVIFTITRDDAGAVTAETRTWMLLPDENGYRAYVTETKHGTGPFTETAQGQIYDPNADGVPEEDTTDGSQQAAALGVSAE